MTIRRVLKSLGLGPANRGLGPNASAYFATLIDLKSSILSFAIAALSASVAPGAPVESPWLADGLDDTACVSAAPMSGWFATGDTFENRVEVRDVQGVLRRVVTQADIAALAPWMSLDGGPDGPSGLAFSASGRLLHILVHDDTLAGDGLASDVLLRLDVSSGQLTRQSRLEAFDRGDIWPHLGMAHHQGRLYIGTGGVGGGPGSILVHVANANSGGSAASATWTLPGGAGAGPVHGIAIDRDAATIYVANDAGLHRAAIPGAITGVPTFTTISTINDARGLAWGDHFGAASQRGLYVLRGMGGGGNGTIGWIPASLASTTTGLTPAAYASAGSNFWHAIAFTAEGRLLVGADEDAVVIRDDADTRLGMDAWMRDELLQNVVFSRGLISPDGEPAGWVIDADTTPALARFHPATPDGAAWVILTLLAHHAINADANAQADIRGVLVRYAGLAADGIRPVRSADGIYKHWLNPLTGNTKPGWPDEYATLSTMKIVVAAARAMDRFPDDPQLVRAAARIIFRTRNWDVYLQSGTQALAFKGLISGASGPDTSSWARPFHEGILFAEQCGVYGGTFAQSVSTAWFNRGTWPTASFVVGRPITSANFGQFDPAFLSIYPALLSSPFRASTAPLGWRTQIENIRWSNAAWTDDNATLYATVFSAGTSPNGYNADTLVNRPGNVSTFSALMALACFGDTPEAVGAYAAYRKGARQTFRTGASILYRRSTDSGSTFVPNSAGLPDVSMGVLGLAELIQPGVIDAVLARPYPTWEMCPVDVNGDGRIDIDDVYALLGSPQDLNGDGVANVLDHGCLLNWLRRSEPGEISGR